jgi:hypothetical protein
MKKVVLLSLVLWAALGCKQAKIINHQKMANLLLDMQLADAYTNLIANDSDKVTKLMRNSDSLNFYYNTIFMHHKVDSNTFRTNYEWYIAHPHELDSVLKIMEKETGKWNAGAQ